ncbi:MAG: argininosuccinate synthase [Thermoplasmatales archaeon]|nr:MAG: argininosuccinate synthase [Thermoplasmatales archaeon]
MKKKLILAYSGGLDTSVMLNWLKNKGYDVIAYIADVGQNEDLKKVKEKAFKTGASKVYLEDLKKEFVEHFIFQAIKANAIYEGKYLLGTAIARPIIAEKQVEIAKKEKTNILAHGCTGKGNDQVRFELAWMQLMPNVEIVSPWKNKEWLKQFKGRSDLIDYAKKKKIPVDVTYKKPYSTDENLMHISYESGILEETNHKPDSEMFKLTKSPIDAPDKETEICIEFEKGIPIKVTNITKNKVVQGSLSLFEYLNELASENAVGRTDIVEDRFVGIKSRGVYETPAGTVLLKAHQDIESITLDREVIHLKGLMAPIMGKLIYNGFWYSPEMKMLMAAIDKSQENVKGKVYLTLYKGNVTVTGRESECSLYNKELSSMDEEGCYDQKDATGFIKITGLRLKHETLAKKIHTE